jgi:hypothetical protein
LREEAVKVRTLLFVLTILGSGMLALFLAGSHEIDSARTRQPASSTQDCQDLADASQDPFEQPGCSISSLGSLGGYAWQSFRSPECTCSRAYGNVTQALLWHCGLIPTQPADYQFWELTNLIEETITGSTGDMIENSAE